MPVDGATDYAIVAGGQVIAEAFGRSSVTMLHDAGANAALMASAPDLLAAAKHAAMEWRLHGQLTDSCRVLEAAIAKAEGK